MTSETPQRPKITFSTQATHAPQSAHYDQAYQQQYAQQAALVPPAKAGPSFWRRNALPLAAAAVFVLTFVLGIMTTLVFMGNNQYTQAPVVVQQPTLQAAVSESLNRSVTRAQAPDLLD